MAVCREVTVVAVTILAWVNPHKVAPSLVLEHTLNQNLALLVGLLDKLTEVLFLNPVESLIVFNLLCKLGGYLGLFFIE